MICAGMQDTSIIIVVLISIVAGAMFYAILKS